MATGHLCVFPWASLSIHAPLSLRQSLLPRQGFENCTFRGAVPVETHPVVGLSMISEERYDWEPPEPRLYLHYRMFAVGSGETAPYIYPLVIPNFPSTWR